MMKECSRNALVLLSGGIDSFTAAAIAKAEGYTLYALSFDYNQRHRVELESARRAASFLKAERHLIISFDLRDIGGSALTSEASVPKDCVPVLRSKEDKQVIPITYVPARNTIFLSFGLAWAEVLGAEDIFIGANALDYSGYPDCRPEYLDAFETMANLATKASVEGRARFRIRAPLLHMSKAEIIKKGAALGLDYSITWSCYDPQPLLDSGETGSDSNPANRFTPCGACDSCLFRKRGFAEAGLSGS